MPIDGEVRVSPAARFVIDDESLDDLKVGRDDDGGALTIVDVRLAGAERRMSVAILTAVVVAAVLGVGGLLIAPGDPASDRPQGSAVVDAHAGARPDPALVVGIGVPDAGRTSASTRGRRDGRRR